MTAKRKPAVRLMTEQRFSRSLDILVKNLSETGRGRKQALSIVVDSTIAVGALWLAYSMRHGQPFSDFRSTWYVFVIMPFATSFAFSALGVYRWVIRSSNERLYRQLAKGSILSAFALLLVFFLLPPDRANPRSLFFIYGLILMCGSIGIRLLWKGLFGSGDKGEPVAIYGAGAAGQQLVSLLAAGDDFKPVAFVDDDPELINSTLCGLPVVFGSEPSLARELRRLDTTGVVLAMPSISSSEYQEKLRQVDVLGYRALTMPSVTELIYGAAKADEIRDVSISDILGRSEVAPDVDLMCRRVTGKCVMVTGGGGSIGSELCRQILNLAPRQLIVLDNSEANLYHITEEISKISKNASDPCKFDFLPVLCSVTDKLRIGKLLKENSVDTIYHAAAYKHVPIVEAQPDQGVEVNVFGTLTVLDAAIDNEVSDFLLISTDKAVRPANVMGGTKRIAELVLQAKARGQNKTCISMVRFGNVLGSSGSVVPKFKEQIKSGGPITLTHSDVTRYFMTIPEAAQLVLQASAIARGGDVFVLDMGEPVRIEQLAISMVHRYGKKLKRDTGNNQDIEIVVEGLRPGEKMYEELFLSENINETEVSKISTADEKWVEWEVLESELNELNQSVILQNLSLVKAIVMRLACLSVAKTISKHSNRRSVLQNDLGNVEDLRDSKVVF